MSKMTWATGALAGVFLVLVVWQAFVLRTQENLPQMIAIAALYLGFSAEHSASRIIETLKQAKEKQS